VSDPEGLIASLDAALLANGEDVILRRQVGERPNVVNIDIGVRAGVRSYQPHELVGDIKQTDSHVIISPTQIREAQWPGGSLPNQKVDPSLPRMADRCIIAGRDRAVEVVNPFYVNGELVRIEMRVLG
jgi:hypothetical protein